MLNPKTCTSSAVTRPVRPSVARKAKASGTPAKFEATPEKVMSVGRTQRSEEHTSELQSRLHLVCRLLLEKKKKKRKPQKARHIKLESRRKRRSHVYNSDCSS